MSIEDQEVVSKAFSKSIVTNSVGLYGRNGLNFGNVVFFTGRYCKREYARSATKIWKKYTEGYASSVKKIPMYVNGGLSV